MPSLPWTPSGRRPATGPADSDPTAGRAAPEATRRPMGWIAVVTLAVVVLDQLTKAWALIGLQPRTPVPVLGELLQLRLVMNPGAALSLGTGSTWLLTLLATVVVVVLVRLARRIASLWWAWAFGLLLGGAVGNLIDRLFREPGVARGHVVDFIDYAGLFVGNVADIAIVVAAGVIIVLVGRGVGLDGRPSLPPRASAEGAADD